jgi:hypothetical protein
MSTIDVTVQVLDGVDTISVNNVDTVSSIIVSEASPSVNNITVTAVDDIDQISVNYDSAIDNITVTEVIPQIQVIQVDAGDQNLVYSVNDRIGSVKLTYTQTLTYVSPSSGVYTYQIPHNLGNETPVAMVYNNENDIVVTEIEVVDTNTINVVSMSNLNGFRVVVQI